MTITAREDEKWMLTLSKAIGRDSFSIGAVAEEAVDDACDGIETVEAAEQTDEVDELIYTTS